MKKIRNSVIGLGGVAYQVNPPLVASASHQYQLLSWLSASNPSPCQWPGKTGRDAAIIWIPELIGIPGRGSWIPVWTNPN